MRRRAILIALLAIAGCTTANEQAASGSIELTQTDVAALVPARVLRVLVEEGATVRRGDTLVTLSQSALPADIDQRRARVVAAEAELRDLQDGTRPSDLERAQAELKSAETDADRTARDAERLAKVAAAGGISQSQLDAAQAAASVAASRREALRQALQTLRDGARPERVQAARAAVSSARAQLAMAEAAATDLVLLAPTDGVVIGRYVEPGEAIGAGVPTISLGDPRKPWIRVYVAAPALARLAVGQGASVRLQGVTDRVFPARIVAIAQRAEFTPRVALTEQERADLLFGVKLDLLDTTGTAKAGVPATVSFDSLPPVARK